MKQQELFKKIGNIVKEINEQYEYLQQAGELFNDLELELMAANANFLSDHIEILRKTKRSDEKEAPPKPSPEERASEYFKASPLASAGDSEGTQQPAKTQEWFIPETRAELVEDKNPEPETIRHELTLDDIGEDWDEDEAAEETYIKPEPVIAKVIEPEIIAPKPEPIVERAIEPEVIIPEPVIEKVIVPPVIAPQAELHLPTPQPPPAPEPVKPVVVDEPQVLTFNQRIAASRTAEPAAPQPISDLKSAITLNDKLLYIKDLFNGYSLAYSEALDILNRFHTFEEAQSFLKSSYALKNNWTDKEATSDKFYALLRRRYL